MNPAIFTIITAALASTGLWTFLQTVWEKKIKKDGALEELASDMREIRKDLTIMSDKFDERNAVTARVRILRFSDEMQEGKLHTKDSFDQVLADIKEYDQYCKKNPDFKNHQTELTTEYIQTNYLKRLDKHDFLVFGGDMNE